jgi:hypothetical protein
MGLEGGHLGILPLVNEQLVVHPQAHPIVYRDGEAVGAGVKPDVALPAGGEVVDRDAGVGGTVALDVS